MRIEMHSRGDYQVLRIEDELAVISDLSELTFLIEGYLKHGKRHIAVGFTTTSYIYSGAVAVLINCLKKIRDEGGDLCIIEPNPEMLSILSLININKIITIYESENDLPEIQFAKQAAPAQSFRGLGFAPA
jgi:anti-sigma B factor antagonist